jgi:hypothetical protein
MGTMPLEPTVLELAADHGEWVEAQVVARRVVRPTVEDYREER